MRYIIVSISSGIIFAVIDGFINANPLAQKLFEVYKSIAKNTVNIWAGIVIDLAYGFIMAGIFLLIFDALPYKSGVMKGLSFGILIWFFRVVMSVASQWMMFNVPVSTLIYTLVTGLAEMLVLGLFYGLTLRPSP
jgi:hypothetical protein